MALRPVKVASKYIAVYGKDGLNTTLWCEYLAEKLGYR